MRELLFAFLGWCLGILGSGVSERIRRTNRRTDMVRSVSAELSELQYTLVAVAWKLRSHLGTATDSFVDWSLPIIKSYNGPSKSPTLADAIAASRQFTEAQRRQADLQARGPNMGLSLKTYKMAFVEARCVAAADTRDEALALIREAIELHIDDLRQSGQRVPPPSSTGEVIEIPAA